MTLIEFLQKNIDLLSLSEISRVCDIERSKMHRIVHKGAITDDEADAIREVLHNLFADIESLEG
jgi:DNA-binding IclR family transcriptional regulator